MGQKMKPRKPKPEVSLLDQLSAPLRSFVTDFKAHGATTLEDLRQRNPEKYIEQSIKLIGLIATLKPEPSGFHSTRSMQDIGRELLKSVGCSEDAMSDGAVEEVIAANDIFIAKLEAIRARAEGEIH
jgi:hypothetical protein